MFSRFSRCLCNTNNDNERFNFNDISHGNLYSFTLKPAYAFATVWKTNFHSKHWNNKILYKNMPQLNRWLNACNNTHIMYILLYVVPGQVDWYLVNLQQKGKIVLTQRKRKTRKIHQNRSHERIKWKLTIIQNEKVAKCVDVDFYEAKKKKKKYKILKFFMFS